jgi:hypothetical protein
MHEAFPTSSEKEDNAEEVDGQEEGGEGGQQHPANYKFSLIFKLNFIFN